MAKPSTDTALRSPYSIGVSNGDSPSSRIVKNTMVPADAPQFLCGGRCKTSSYDQLPSARIRSEHQPANRNTPHYTANGLENHPYQFLVPGQEEDVLEQFPGGFGLAVGFDPVLLALGKKAEGGYGGAQVFAHPRQLARERHTEGLVTCFARTHVGDFVREQVAFPGAHTLLLHVLVCSLLFQQKGPVVAVRRGR